MGVIFVCNKLLLKANNIIINASLGLDVEQQDFLYLVLGLLILAVGSHFITIWNDRKPVLYSRHQTICPTTTSPLCV